MTTLPYVKLEKINGKAYIYVRRGSAERIRLYADEGTPEFFAEYAAALEQLVGPSEDEAARHHTWRYLASQYFKWHGFAELATSTQQARRNVLEQVLASIARDDYRKLTAQDVIRLIDAKADLGKPEAARSRLKAFRHLLDYAVSRVHLEHNVARDRRVVEVTKQLRTNPDGHRTWTRDNVAAYFRRWEHGTREHLRLTLLLYTGVRISDAAILGPQHEHEGFLEFNETKGRDRYGKPPTVIPILEPLRDAIDATPTGDLVYLTTTRGHSWRVKSLAQRFVKDCRIAGLEPGLSAHGVRKAAATFAAEAGATENELMAMFGWSSPKQAAAYTRKVNRPRLATQGFTKLELEENKLAKRDGAG